MLFKKKILEGIAAGHIELAFRRWKRPTVKAGGTLQSPVGLLMIHSVTSTSERQITAQEVKLAGYTSRAELIASLADNRGKVYRIEFSLSGPDPRIALRKEEQLNQADIEKIRTRLHRMDSRSQTGAWTTDVLRIIEAHPETRAADLAEMMGVEKEWLKPNVRKLKNLGLTESLEIGYRLSPRGVRYLMATQS